MPGCGEGCSPRLQECQHGCKKHLGDIISFFFRFISGNLARGEGCLAGSGDHVLEDAIWGWGLGGRGNGTRDLGAGSVFETT